MHVDLNVPCISYSAKRYYWILFGGIHPICTYYCVGERDVAQR